MGKSNERWLALETGEVSVEEFVNSMDEEELARGQLRSKRGLFDGKPPTRIPRNFHQAIVREVFRRTESEFRDGILDAVRHLKFLATNADRDDVQLKATLAWIERVLGKVPERVNVQVDDRQASWEAAVDKFLNEQEPSQIEKARRILGQHDYEPPRQIVGTSRPADDDQPDADDQPRDAARTAMDHLVG